MAGPWEHKPQGGTSRTSGISADAITAGANLLGDEIDNATNLDDLADIELVFSHGSNPTEDEVYELYLIYAKDGTNYEDGGAAVDPKKAPDGSFAVFADTSTHRSLVGDIPLLPYKFKILIKSEVSVNGTLTVNVVTRNDQTAEV
jgi:hypothetical protein